MATQLEVIQKFMKSLDTTNKKGTAALDEAIQACSNFSGIQAVIAKMKSDIAATNNAEKFLKDYCGIDLSNTDTGAITSSDAGGSTTKTATNIVPESGSLDTSFKKNYFTLSNYGVTFCLRELDSNGRVTGTLSFDDLTPQQQYIWQGLYTWWASNALALVTESYGSNFKFSSGTSTYPKIIYFGFYNRADSSLAESGPLGAEGEASTFVFRVNMDKFDSINTSDSNGVASNGEYLDRTLAHELTHCAMAANIKYYTSLPQFIKEGMAELTIGGDDGGLNQGYMKSLAMKSATTQTGSNKSFLDSALNLTDTSTGDAKAYAGGYMFLRYLAEQAADSGTIVDGTNNTVSNISLTGSAKADNIKNSGSYVTIYSGAGNDTITNFLKSGGGYGNYALINAGDGRDNISVSGSYYVSVNGGADNDTITDNGGYKSYYNGGAENDLISVKSTYWDFTLEGGKGNDTIINNTKDALYKYNSGSGNDLINGFNETSTLQIGGGTGTYSTTKSGSDIIVTVGEGKITLTGAASLSSVNIAGTLVQAVSIDSSKSNTILTGTAYNDTILNYGDFVTIDGGAGEDSIHNDGSNVTINGGAGKDKFLNHNNEKVSINGGSGNDSINNFGSKVTMFGSSGNDTLWNNSGGDKVSANGGKGDDYIVSWGNNSTLIGGNGNDSITNAIKAYNGNNSLMADGVGKNVMIQGGSGKDSIVNRSDNVTISGGDDNDFLWNSKFDGGGNNISISGGTGSDSIISGGSKVTIIGGVGNDLISLGSDTKNNLIVYKSGDGNDSIKGFNVNSTLRFGSSTNVSLKTSGKNVIATVGNGKITLQGAASLNVVNIQGSSGNDYIKSTVNGAKIDALSGNDKIYNYATSTVTISGGKGADTITNWGSAASMVGGSGNDLIWGDDGNDTLLGGKGNDKLHGEIGNDKLYGGKGNDSLWGGKGNDTLWGDAGKDTFFYSSGDGKDVIFGFENDDMLKITGAFSASYNKSKKEIYFKVGSTKNAITLKNFDATTFNINGDVYHISGKKLVK